MKQRDTWASYAFAAIEESPTSKLYRRAGGVVAALALGVCELSAGQQAQDRASNHPRPTLIAQKTLQVEAISSEDPDEELQRAASLRKRLTKDTLEAAIRLFTDSARRFSASGEMQKASLAELQAGDSYQMMSRFRRALAAYHRALALSGGQGNAQCSALVRITRSYANIGRHEEAEQYSERAAEACGSLNDKRAMASALEAQGEVHFWLGDAKAAMDALGRAEQLATETNDWEIDALSTMIQAEIAHTSDIDQATSLVRKSLVLWRKAGDDYGVARTQQTMAFFAIEEGDFSRAHCHCDKAFSLFQRIHDTDNEAVTLNDLGLIAKSLGNLEEALDDYQKARRDFASVQDDLGVADSIDGMVDVLESEKEFDPVLPLYRSEVRIGNTTKNRSFLAAANLEIADVHRHFHRDKEAESEYAKSAREYAATGNPYGEGKAFARLASVLIDEGRFQESLPLLEASEKIASDTGEKENLAKLEYLRALMDYRSGKLERSLQEIEKTTEIVESQRLRITRFDSRAQYFAFIHDYYSLYIRVLMALNTRHPEQDYGRRAFEVAERSKVRALLDMLERQTPVSACDELLAHDATRDSAEREGTVAERSSVTAAHALGLNEVQSEIRDNNTDLLEFAIGNDEGFAWVLDGDTIFAFDLGPSAEIRTSASAFSKLFFPLQPDKDESPASYLRRRQAAKEGFLVESKRLSKLLFGQVHIPLGKRLVIVPDGPIQNIPFDALFTSGPSKDSAQLINTNEVIMEPSVSVLAVLRRAAAGRPRAKDEVTVFADPVFELQGGTVSGGIHADLESERPRDLFRAMDDLQRSRYIPQLPGSRSEAFAIQKIVGPKHTRLALGFDASREAIINGSVSEDRIVHFATHGILDADHPEISGLILSLVDRRGERQDGYLRLSDIYNLRFSADLVVLSSCESALGKNLGSEGIIGLPRGFLYAGARSVIASLWKVDDDATAAMMKALYTRMQQGQSASAALRGAKLELLANRRYSDPFYWAAFVLEGDYK